MFIIEKFINDFNVKQEAYERARDKWIKEGADSNGYNYRSPRDYRNRHGASPQENAKKVLRLVLQGLFIAGLCFAIFMFISHVDVSSEPKPVKAASEYKNGEDCGKFKIGDTANIKYGDYQGAEVEIIGGCEEHTDYETRVTKDQVLNAEGSENEEYNDKPIQKGLIIKVDSSDNLSKTGHIEPEKEQ